MQLCSPETHVVKRASRNWVTTQIRDESASSPTAIELARRHRMTRCTIISPDEQVARIEPKGARHRNTPKEKLLEFMKEASDIGSLHALSQEELAKTYCERLAYGVINR
jgi:hypothetical protein